MAMAVSLAAIEGARSEQDAGLDSDARLALLARRDPGAFSPLYRRHYPMIVGYLYRRLGDAHVAEDLAADTFIAALNAIGRYRPTGAPFRAWLLRIATNLANNHVRQAARRRARLSCIEQWKRDRPAADDEAEAARAALAALTPDHQAVLCLHHVEGLRVEEIAVILGCRVGTVKSRLSRAREAMRSQLEGERS
jgi:RNA polymerase sigma-70 factor (ECF subfamily)